MSLTSKNNEKIGAVNRGTPCESGLCNFCRTDCQGRCETWLSSLLGRRTLVPRDYGNATIGTENTTHVGVSYNALRIRGRVFGGAGLDPEKARSYYESSKPECEGTCTMCGKMCPARTMKRILAGEDVSIR